MSLTTSDTQDFNTLAGSGTALFSTLPTGFFAAETGSGANISYAAGPGTDNTGDTYSYGEAASAERALGSLGSGGVSLIYFGACYQNNTGQALDALNVTFTGEQWRLGQTTQTADKLDFQYSLTETTVSGADFEDFDALDFPSPVTNGTTGPLDGNLAANQTFKTAKISGLNLPPGETVFIRWRDVNTAGSDNGLAVDNLTVAAVNAPTITSIANQTLPVNSSTGTLGFTIGDVETDPDNLTLTAQSDNQTLAPNANITLGGAGASRTITVTPAAGQSGVATITLTVTDADGNATATTFTVIVGIVPQCAAGAEIVVTPGSAGTGGGITLYASSQSATPAAIDMQDDAWRAGLLALTPSLLPGTPSGLDGVNRNAVATITTAQSRVYTVTTREMSGGTNAPPCQGGNISVGKTVNSNNTVLQAAAPRPTNTVIASTVYSYAENLGGFNANSGSRNALLFEFDSSVRAFGAWFGDAEGRADSTPLLVRFFDAAGERIGSDFIVDETSSPFGDSQTRWLGFTSETANVKSMLVMVGDAEAISFAGKLRLFPNAPQQGQGYSEHLSFIGGTFGEAPTGSSVVVGGYVVTQLGWPVRHARVTLAGIFGGTRAVTANRWGYYEFPDVETGQSYYLSVSAKGYAFTPQTQIITPLADNEEVNFLAFPQ